MTQICAVCESPTAYTLHFGGRCCKACAAFFRRTIALNLKYECTSNQNCQIHFTMRLVCRECRLRKCFSAQMKPELVRSKRENFTCTRKNRKELIYQSPIRQISMSPETGDDDDDWNFQYNNDKIGESSLTNMNDETSLASSFDGGYYSPYQPSTSSTTFVHECRNFIPPMMSSYSILNHYLSIETALSSKRRIIYTQTDMDYIFDNHENLQCPFNYNELRPHDYRNFKALFRHDFAMLFDFVIRFPEFSTFTNHEKNMFYRLLVGVDFIMSSAFYTYRLGQASHQMVLTNGEYVQMDPLPLTGCEPNARQYFDSEEDFSKYKALMPMHIEIWQETVLPFSKLDLSFEEYVLIKALTIWHVTYYKLTEEGREKCRRQRNIIIESLSRLCHNNGGGESRMGELLMSMNYIMESVSKLRNSYVLITFFDVLNCDSMLHEMLTFKY